MQKVIEPVESAQGEMLTSRNRQCTRTRQLPGARNYQGPFGHGDDGADIGQARLIDPGANQGHALIDAATTQLRK
jgi:hypothetical protein